MNNYYTYIKKLDYDGGVDIEKNRYLTLTSPKKGSVSGFPLHGKVDNLFLSYESEKDADSEINYLYVTGAYNSMCLEESDGVYKHMIICDSIEHHTKSDIEEIKNRCENKKRY